MYLKEGKRIFGAWTCTWLGTGICTRVNNLHVHVRLGGGSEAGRPTRKVGSLMKNWLRVNNDDYFLQFSFLLWKGHRLSVLWFFLGYKKVTKRWTPAKLFLLLEAKWSEKRRVPRYTGHLLQNNIWNNSRPKYVIQMLWLTEGEKIHVYHGSDL
jgi:hypothetical protein